MDWLKESRDLGKFKSLRTTEDGENDSRMWLEMGCDDYDDGRLKNSLIWARNKEQR